MVVLGIDTHKRTHTVVAIDDRGRKLAERTLATNSRDHLDLVAWADRLDPEHVAEQIWAVEDCRHLSRRLERDLLHARRRVVRVHPKLMAHMRDSARTYGKSDPIDALAVARAALREPDLPAAHLDGPARDVRLLVDHRDDLVAERTRVINRLRWHLHELDPDLQIPARTLHRPKHLQRVAAFLASPFEESASVVVRLARALAHRCADLTEQIGQVERDIKQQIERLAPTLLAITGCGHLSAAKILGETAGVDRFHSKDAYARYTGTAPLPVWSGNKERHRLSRVGNRQLNAALHRIAITQARYHPGARQLLNRRRAVGDSTAESLRVLKRRLSDVVYQALRTDSRAPCQQDPVDVTAA
jgi:transposase